MQMNYNLSHKILTCKQTNSLIVLLQINTILTQVLINNY